MSALAAVVRLSEEAGATEHTVISPYVFGGSALAVLILLLIITLMINVDR
ncbi:MAG: hypothetical protein ACKOFP_11145 [Actinomycetota bacterium]